MSLKPPLPLVVSYPVARLRTATESGKNIDLPSYWCMYDEAYNLKPLSNFEVDDLDEPLTKRWTSEIDSLGRSCRQRV